MNSFSSPGTFDKAASILIFGHDSGLLDSRKMVLERHGYTVMTTLNFVESSQLLLTQDIGLLILCSTLSDEECHRMSTLAQGLRPAIKVLVLDSYDERRNITDGAVVFSDFVRPLALLNAVREMGGRKLSKGVGAYPDATRLHG